MTPRELIHQLKDPFNSAIEAIGKGLKWLWNTILDTPFSTYSDILFWVFIGLVVSAMILSLVNGVKGFLGFKPISDYKAGYKFGQWLRMRTKRLR